MRLRALIDAKLKGEGIDMEEEAPRCARATWSTSWPR